jgi:hypothetical protein
VLPREVLVVFPWVLFGICVLLLLIVVKQLITWASLPPGSGMPAAVVPARVLASVGKPFG